MHEGLARIRNAAVVAASCAATAAVFGIEGHAAAAPAPTMASNLLMGPLVSYQFLLGSWTCWGAPKSEDTKVTLLMTIGAENTVQVVSRSRTSTNLGFYGFDAVSKLWWLANVDSDGGRSFQTSRSRVDYAGTIETRENSFPLRSTMTKLSDTKFRTVTEEQIDGAWVTSADTTCTKP
jgi:hypothetical protein